MKPYLPREILFGAGSLRIVRVTETDLDSCLQVYQQCEDFLSLGPVAKASMAMLSKDINHSRRWNGLFCGIWNELDNPIGVIDFIPSTSAKTARLELLMIARPFRNMGFGSEILRSLESYLKRTYKTNRIASGVQANNEGAIRFWKRHGFHLEERGCDMGDGTTAYQMYKNLL